ncbi:MAG: glycosyltransferase family 2 protein, partial [Proteobacteria bacterium]|nr:glycosyltransferase family 2 protein [Pseudomonadota bacterium]
IIIPNYNGLSFLPRCLENIQAQTFTNFEIILVDNGSSDESVLFVKANFPGVKTLVNKKNLGFSQANNQGIRQAKGKYILTLNNDCFIEKNFIEELVQVTRQSPDIGSASGKIYRIIDSKKTNILDTTGHIIFKNRHPANRGQGEPDHGQYDQPEFIFQGSAVACLYRREMLEDIKLEGEYFDERFFAFYEDFDLGWRAQIRGWKHFYQPRAVGYHWTGRPIQQMPRLGGRLDLRNWHLLLIKNDRWSDLARNFPKIFLYDLKRFGLSTFLHPSLFLGWLQILLAFSRAIRQHNKIMTSRKVPDEEIRKFFLENQ